MSGLADEIWTLLGSPISYGEGGDFQEELLKLLAKHGHPGAADQVAKLDAPREIAPGEFARTIEAGYTVEFVEPPQTSSESGWMATGPDGEEVSSGKGRAGLWPFAYAAWVACDNHRMFGDPRGAQ
jgi:hypothetical protein